jgi:very-short-patch-repair endonuclease
MRGQWAPPSSATDHGGAFTTTDAREAGYSQSQVRRLVRTGQWVVVIGKVLVSATASVTPVTVAWAAALAVGVGGVVSHLTAARLWGLLVPPDAEAHVIVGRNRRVRIRGLRTHRVPLPDDDVTTWEGIPATTLVRTVVDCLLWLPVESGIALLADAQRRRIVTVDQLRAYLMTSPCRHGMGRAWTVVQESVDAFSVAEVRLHRILRTAGLSGWRKNIEIFDADGSVGWVDVIFDREKLVIEIDGRRYHSGDAQFQQDRTKQNRLVMLGYTPLRFTWEDITERGDEVARQVLAAVRAAA